MNTGENTRSSRFSLFIPHLDLLEVHRLADELVVFRQLLARRQLDEDFAQLSAVTAGREHISRGKMAGLHWSGPKQSGPKKAH